MDLEIKLGQLRKLQIETLGPWGEGVASFGKRTIFIDGALPGETVLAEVTVVKESYAHALLLEVIESSPDRREPPCPYFDRCGGCQIMHLDYPAQRQLKQERVRQALRSDVVLPCLPSPEIWGYRNKIQLPIKEGAFGLYARRSQELVSINDCLVHCPLGEKIFHHAKNLLEGSTPEIQYLLIRTAIHTKQALVTFVCKDTPSQKLQEIARNLMTECLEIAGVFANVNKQSGNAILGDDFIILAGQSHMTEQLCGLTLQLSPASFFQVNTSQAEKLYPYAIESLKLTEQETLLDAYCGIGTLSLMAAPFAKEVFGIECVKQAINDAKENARINDTRGCHFICGDAANASLLNPPRKGCEKRLLDSLIASKPDKIVYISCNPKTLARDVDHLKSGGFSLERAQPFDMFPHTTHVETVASLTIQ
jgi:23S rRNA (uracil1939-C5)-methyltransferase